MPQEIDAALYLEYKMLDEAIKDLTKKRDALDARIRESAGNEEELTVDGQKVFTYARIDRMRTTDLRKNDPDLYAQFLFTVTKKEFNTEAFKRQLPNVYQEYQSRRLVRVDG